jgi:hypothetical protein
MSLISFCVDFAQRWLGSLPRLMLTLLAALMVVLVITALWEFRSFLTRGGLTRELRGTRLGAPLVIAVAFFAVLGVGFATPQAMIGDEVTHYYMLVKQAEDISQPNFYADIPMANGEIEVRRYPHSFGWHYFGALAYLVTGGSFFGVQLYQAFFLLQLLTVAYLLARDRGGVESRAALLYVLTLASLPLCLLFSVAFYQDVPMTAQVLTAFYLLSKRRWLWAACFMALAVGFKVTAVLFFPAFFLLVLWEGSKRSWASGLLALTLAAVVVLGSSWTLGRAINIYANAPFYPQEKIVVLYTVVKNRILAMSPKVDIEPVSQIVSRTKEATARHIPQGESPETAPTIIANHPGDLRIKENYLIYGGLLLWLVILASPFGALARFRGAPQPQPLPGSFWLLLVGGSFLLGTAYLTRTAPDARFFLPGLPFVLLPAVERVVSLPKSKALVAIVAVLALLQTGHVLHKTYNLRAISPGILAGIDHLRRNPPEPNTIFMYPEGNYRLFPQPHEWYLGYQLREFWRADNDQRLMMLNRYGIGAVVVKKHLVAPVDEEITNLGVYPPEFVDDLRGISASSKALKTMTC